MVVASVVMLVLGSVVGCGGGVSAVVMLAVESLVSVTSSPHSNV